MEISEKHYNELVANSKELAKIKDFVFCQEVGAVFQDKVTDALFRLGISVNNYTSGKYQQNKGENKIGLEIKHDSKIKDTGNLFMEFEAISKDGKRMVAGGFMKEDKSWLYGIGSDRTLYLFSKIQLQYLFQDMKKQPEYFLKKYGIKICKHYDPAGIHTSSGMIIPLKSLKDLRICLKVVDL